MFSVDVVGTPVPSGGVSASTSATAAALQSRLTASQLHNIQQRKILAAAQQGDAASKLKVKPGVTGCVHTTMVLFDCRIKYELTRRFH